MLTDRKILIVEDEPKILEVIKAYLEKDGWLTEVAYDAETALDMFMANQPDMLIVDIMLGAMSGIELTEKIRGRSTIPIIMVTSKAREEERIQGLYLGADDYISKPFSPKELVARVNAVYRRTALYIDKGDTKYTSFDHGRLQIDYQKMEIFINGRSVSLTNTEYKIFSSMSRMPDKIYSRGDLLFCVQGYRFIGDPRSIDAHIKNIRHKVEENPKEPKIITTVIGVGYKFGVNRDA